MTINVSAFVPDPDYSGMPVGYGDGTQDAGPGEFAFISDIVAADYTPLTANKTATPATLSTVLAGIEDGDVITLEDGNYTSISLSGKSIFATIQAASYQGAVFSGGISISTSTSIRVAGVKAKSLSWTDCARSSASYVFIEGAITSNRTNLISFSTHINWYKCVADMGWPDPPTLNPAGFIKQVHGAFDGIITTGAQDHTIKSCIFMRGTEDNAKVTYCKEVGFIDCVFWGCQVLTAGGDLYHPDAIQLASHYTEPDLQCADIWFVGCGFINTELPLMKEGQGLWAKDGLYFRFRVINCLLTSGLNSIGLGFHDVHTDSVVRRCSCTQNVRMSGTTNEYDSCIFGVNQLESGADAPIYTNNIIFGFDDPDLNTYQFGREPTYWELRSFLPQLETVWNNQGASELLYRCHLRMVAEGLTGFVPSGWTA